MVFTALAVGAASAAAGGISKGIADRRAQKFVRARHREYYQYERKSLEDAGYNPLLGLPGGASLPGVATAGGGDGGAGFTAGAQASQRKQAVKLGKADVKLREHQLFQSAASAKRDANLADLAMAQTRTEESKFRGQEIENFLRSTQMPSAKAVMEFDETPMGTNLRKIHRAMEGGGTAAGVAGKILRRGR